MGLRFTREAGQIGGEQAGANSAEKRVGCGGKILRYLGKCSIGSMEGDLSSGGKQRLQGNLDRFAVYDRGGVENFDFQRSALFGKMHDDSLRRVGGIG